MKIKIKPKKVSKKNFNKFGQIIDTSKKKYFKINDGYAKRYDNLGKIDTSIKKGTTIVSIFSAKKRKFPMKIDMMEKHPLGSQAFVPMKETSFLVFVAPKGKEPNLKKVESFRITKKKGIKNMNFLVIDRKGKGNNLIIHKFKKEKIYLSK
jgi:ureidoglycolate lyase